MMLNGHYKTATKCETVDSKDRWFSEGKGMLSHYSHAAPESGVIPEVDLRSLGYKNNIKWRMGRVCLKARRFPPSH